MRTKFILLIPLTCFLPFASNGQWIKWEDSEGGNGHWYQVVKSPELISWDMASKEALKLGGYLATLTSKEENDFVFALASDTQYWVGEFGPLLGGYQPPGSQEPAGGWTWVSGEPWNYSNWAGGQPDNGGNGPVEDMIHFWGGNKWNDQYTNALNFVGYVVERELPRLPVVNIRTSEVDISWLADQGTIYQLEYRSDLTEGRWVPLMNPIVGVGTIYSTYDTLALSEPRRFYRVIKQE